MAEETFAARLRREAAAGRTDVRDLVFPQFELVKPVRLDPDEAAAIADALEAADGAPCTCPPSWVDTDTGELVRGDPALWCDFHAALDRLNARVAVKSAEGRPES